MMRAQRYLEWALPPLGVLAALPPSGMFFGLICAREQIKTITQWGPLPEIPISLLHHLGFVPGMILIIAAIIGVFVAKRAAPLAFAAAGALWLFYLPLI